MKRMITILIVSLILLVPMISFATEYEYKSGTEYDYPPFSVPQNGQADGFSVELLKAVADVMGLNITFKVDDWATIKDELRNGELDVLPLVGYTEERDQYFDFTVPYIIMHGNIFIRKDETGISTEDDLFGKEIIVMNGDNAHEYAVRMGFSDHLILTETYQEAFELLASGKYDAVLAQSLVGEQLIEQLNLDNIKAATRIDEDGLTQIRTNLSGFEQKFCFAVTEGNKELLSKLNEGLAIVSANGEFDQLYKKWFPFVINTKPDPIESLKTSLIILSPILITILIVGSIIVKRTIRNKTLDLQKSNNAILEMEAHLRSEQKLEAIGILASGVAHEINNPINGVINYGQLIYDIAQNQNNEYIEKREIVLEFSDEIIRESNRISSIVSNLLQISRSGSKQFVECSLPDLIKRILSLVTVIMKHDQVEIETHIDESLPKIECREQEMQQVLLNLLVNAKDALDAKTGVNQEDRRIIISATETQLSDDTKGIRITVEDNGYGIPEAIQNRIFDPFFTTKNRSEGTGLGLSISFGIIRDHNGYLRFETKEGEYTRFYIDLPLKH